MAERASMTDRFSASGGALVLAFAAAKLIVHLVFIEGYGYFRDELYYLACAEHLDGGYVDHPPLSILLLAGVRALLGDSLTALRLLPAIAGAATVALVGLMARELGGGRLAQALAMLTALVAPIYLALGHFYSMNAFDLLFWAAAAWLTIRILGQPQPRRWLLLGIVLGLGLQNKISVLWLGAGLFVGLVATPARRYLKTPWPWLAGGLAGLIFSPYLLWQVAHGWPTLEFMANATGAKMKPTGFLEFLGLQFLVLSPALALVWGAGLVFYLGLARGRPFRLLGWTWVVVFLILATAGASRAVYLAPAYSWLFAGGAVAWEALLARVGRPVLRRAAAAVLILLIAAGGALVAPLGFPVLPVDTFVAYSRALGIEPMTEERKEVARLPQLFADMHGWEEIVDAFARAYESLPAEERAGAGIFAQNYGVAGAIDLFGRRRGLPPAMSGHNNYWLWGPRGDGGVVIVHGDDARNLERFFGRVELATTIDCGDCMPYENGQPVWICRRPRLSLVEAWPRLKHFN